MKSIVFRDTLCINPETCDAIGLANVASMCKSDAVVIVKDIGLSSTFHIVHEFGHVYDSISIFKSTLKNVQLNF